MRSIRTLQVTTPTDREAAFTGVFDAPRRLVFDTLTKPELLKRWLFGPDDCWLAVFFFILSERTKIVGPYSNRVATTRLDQMRRTVWALITGILGRVS
jgi:hypothetical protein